MLAFSEFDDSPEAWARYDRISFLDLCMKLGVSRRTYDEVFEPMVLTGLFAPGNPNPYPNSNPNPNPNRHRNPSPNPNQVTSAPPPPPSAWPTSSSSSTRRAHAAHVSPMYLPCISRVSPVYLPHISPISPYFVELEHPARAHGPEAHCPSPRRRITVPPEPAPQSPLVLTAPDDRPCPPPVPTASPRLQTSFDVRWCKGNVGEKIFQPW